MPQIRRPAVIAFAARALAVAVGLLASLRHRRGLHPRGEVLVGEVELTAAGRRALGPLSQAAPGATARVSRGAGLPHLLPDIQGIGLRLDGDGVADLLLASHRAIGPLEVPWPRRARAGSYSTISRFRDAAGHRVRIHGHLAEEGGSPAEVRLWLSGLPDGPADLGVVRSLRPAEGPGPRLDPLRRLAGLEPIGWLNGLRPEAYEASRRAAPEGAGPVPSPSPPPS